MIFGKNYFARKIKKYALKDNIWPIVVGTSTYSLELLAAWKECEFFYRPWNWGRVAPEQADVLIVSGHINQAILQVISDTYKRMPEHKKVLAVGTHVIRSGDFELKDYINVDVAVEGDPPRKDDILKGFCDIYQSYEEAFSL